MRKISKSHHSSLNELNITPLLDLAFVLLVIFIITTPQLVNDLEISLPSGKIQKKSDEKQKIHSVLVKTNGTVDFDNTEMAITALKPALTALKQAEPEPAVALRADPDADYQGVILVLDLFRELDITKVGISTDSR